MAKEKRQKQIEKKQTETKKDHRKKRFHTAFLFLFLFAIIHLVLFILKKAFFNPKPIIIGGAFPGYNSLFSSLLFSSLLPFFQLKKVTRKEVEARKVQ